MRATDYGLGQAEEDYKGDQTVEVAASDFTVDLDYVLRQVESMYYKPKKTAFKLEAVFILVGAPESVAASCGLLVCQQKLTYRLSVSFLPYTYNCRGLPITPLMFA